MNCMKTGIVSLIAALVMAAFCACAGAPNASRDPNNKTASVKNEAVFSKEK